MDMEVARGEGNYLLSARATDASGGRNRLRSVGVAADLRTTPSKGFLSP